MTLSNPDIKTFKMGYTTLYIGGLVTIVFTLLFILLGNYFKYDLQVRDAIALFTAGLVSTTLIYTAKNLRLNFEATQAKLQFDVEKFEYDKQVKQEDLKRKVQDYSFQVSSLWHTPAMAVHVELSRSFLRKHADHLKAHLIQEFIKDLEQDPDSRRALVSVLNYFEFISLLIKRKVVDEEIMKDAFKTLFCDYINVLEFYIDEIQKESKRYLMNYEGISDEWSKL